MRTVGRVGRSRMGQQRPYRAWRPEKMVEHARSGDAGAVRDVLGAHHPYCVRTKSQARIGRQSLASRPGDGVRLTSKAFKSLEA